MGWACCRSSRTCGPFFPESSKAQWVPYSDPSLWVSCHGQIMCHPKSLGCYTPCPSAFTGKVVPFGPWRTDGHLRDDHHSILVPCCARNLLFGKHHFLCLPLPSYLWLWGCQWCCMSWCFCKCCQCRESTQRLRCVRSAELSIA